MKAGVYGGTFDPPTKAHQAMIVEALKQLDMVFVVPSYRPIEKSAPRYDFDQRLRMLEALRNEIDDSARRRCVISDCERSFTAYRDGDSPKGVSTWDLMQLFACQVPGRPPGHGVCFVCGPDVGANIEHFHNAEKLMDTFEILTLEPPDEAFSLWRSSAVRSNLSQGGIEWVNHVPAEVAPIMYRCESINQA